MLNTLLIIQAVISFLLIGVILLQKTSVDGASTLSGNNMSLMGLNAANEFLIRTTVILAIAFAVVLLLIANRIVAANKPMQIDREDRIEMQA